MTDLIRRLEVGTAEDQATLIESVWDYVAPTYGFDWSKGKAGQFGRFIDCGAFLDAVMLMVPEGFGVSLSDLIGPGYHASLMAKSEMPYREAFSRAASPALALAAAILKANNYADG